MPVMPALEKWRQEEKEFVTSLSYIMSARPAWAI